MSWESFKGKDLNVVEFQNYEEIVGNELARKFKASGIILAQINPDMRSAGFGEYHSTTPPLKHDKRKFIIFIDSTMSRKNRLETAWHEFGHFKVEIGKLKVKKNISHSSVFYKDYKKFGYPKNKMAEEYAVEEFARSRTKKQQRINPDIKNRKSFSKPRQMPKQNKIKIKTRAKQNNMLPWELP